MESCLVNVFLSSDVLHCRNFAVAPDASTRMTLSVFVEGPDTDPTPLTPTDRVQIRLAIAQLMGHTGRASLVIAHDGSIAFADIASEIGTAVGAEGGNMLSSGLESIKIEKGGKHFVVWFVGPKFWGTASPPSECMMRRNTVAVTVGQQPNSSMQLMTGRGINVEIMIPEGVDLLGTVVEGDQGLPNLSYMHEDTQIATAFAQPLPSSSSTKSTEVTEVALRPHVPIALAELSLEPNSSDEAE